MTSTASNASAMGLLLRSRSVAKSKLGPFWVPKMDPIWESSRWSCGAHRNRLVPAKHKGRATRRLAGERQVWKRASQQTDGLGQLDPSQWRSQAEVDTRA